MWEGIRKIRTDPTGHCWPWCTAIAGAIIGGIVGATISIVQQAHNGGKINWAQVGGAAAVGAAVVLWRVLLVRLFLQEEQQYWEVRVLLRLLTVTTIEITSAISVGLSVGSIAGAIAR